MQDNQMPMVSDLARCFVSFALSLVNLGLDHHSYRIPMTWQIARNPMVHLFIYFLLFRVCFFIIFISLREKCSNIETAPRGRDELVIGDAMMGRSILGQWDHRVNTGHPGLFFFFFFFAGRGVSANNRSGKQWVSGELGRIPS